MRFLALLLLLLPSAASSLDMNAYCAGWCHSRYDWGFYKAGKCGCVDYFPINLSSRITSPLRARPMDRRQPERFIPYTANDDE